MKSTGFEDFALKSGRSEENFQSTAVSWRKWWTNSFRPCRRKCVAWSELVVNCLAPALSLYRGWVTVKHPTQKTVSSVKHPTKFGPKFHWVPHFRTRILLFFFFAWKFTPKLLAQPSRSSDLGWHWAMPLWCLHLRQASGATSWKPSIGTISMDVVWWMLEEDWRLTGFSG